VADLTVVYRAVADLNPYERNARTHSPEQIEQIAASIQAFGWTNPVLVDEAGGIIAGHGRLAAAMSLGHEAVPTICIAGLSDVARRALILADNKLALNAGWDEHILAAELSDLQEFGLDVKLIGFTADELAALVGTPNSAPGLTDEDAVPEVRLDPISRPGDVWLLDEHRVMCGDSTNAADVGALLAGGGASMLWTDPPYGVSYVGKTADALTIENDALTEAQLADFLDRAMRCAFDACAAGAAWYVAAPAGPLHHVFASVLKPLGVWRQTLNWVKNTFALGRTDYHYRHEPIFYGWKPGASHYFVEDRTQDTILEFDKPSRNGEHPTMKPVELVERCVLNSTKPGAVVLDLFGGSGSTLIACEKSRRQSRLMEIDPRYVDVIVRRWQSFTGQRATLEATGEQFPSDDGNTRPKAEADAPEAGDRQPRKARAVKARGKAAAGRADTAAAPV
jgi:DNA modification methylase